MGLRSKHVCGFDAFFRSHQREVALVQAEGNSQREQTYSTESIRTSTLNIRLVCLLHACCVKMTINSPALKIR